MFIFTTKFIWNHHKIFYFFLKAAALKYVFDGVVLDNSALVQVVYQHQSGQAISFNNLHNKWPGA